MSPTPFDQALSDLVAGLQSAGVRHRSGGSVASSMRGEIRTTQVIGVVVDLQREQQLGLVEALRPTFHIDPSAVGLALQSQSSCNALHRATAIKIDLILRRRGTYHGVESERASPVEFLPGRTARVATAEDCVLTKLIGYRKGNVVSDRQWRDVQGVLRVLRSRIDLSCLRLWAPEWGTADLLDRARREASLA